MSHKTSVTDLLAKLFLTDESNIMEPCAPGMLYLEEDSVMLDSEIAVYRCRIEFRDSVAFHLSLSRLPQHMLFEGMVDCLDDSHITTLRQQLDFSIQQDLQLVRDLNDHADDLLYQLRGRMPIDDAWEPVLYGPGLNCKTISVWIGLRSTAVRVFKPKVRYRMIFTIHEDRQIEASIATDNVDVLLDPVEGESMADVLQRSLLGRLDGTSFLRVETPAAWVGQKWTFEDVNALCIEGIQSLEQTLKRRLMPWENEQLPESVLSFLLQYAPARIAAREIRKGNVTHTLDQVTRYLRELNQREVRNRFGDRRAFLKRLSAELQQAVNGAQVSSTNDYRSKWEDISSSLNDAERTSCEFCLYRLRVDAVINLIEQ